jgi:hypothetical protein
MHLFKITTLVTTLLSLQTAFGGQETIIPKEGITKIKVKNIGTLDFTSQKNLFGQKVTVGRSVNSWVAAAIENSKGVLEFEPTDKDVIVLRLPNFPTGGIPISLLVRNPKKLSSKEVYAPYYFIESDDGDTMQPIPASYDSKKHELKFDLPKIAFIRTEDKYYEAFFIVGLAQSR